MRQAKIISKGQVIVENIEVPVPKENEILLKIVFSGLCGSDRLMLSDPSFFSYPVVNGHEIVGIVASEGKKFKKGDRVSVLPMVYCRSCEYCQNEDYNLCKSLLFIGGTPENGGFADYVTVEEDNLFLLPQSLDDETAALIEPASVAYHAIELSNPTRIKKALIIGIGIIGSIALRILKKKYGVEQVDVLDAIDEKLENAVGEGATNSGNIRSYDWKSIIFLNDNPFLAGEYDAIYDFASSSDSVDIGICNIKKSGSIIVVGLPHADIKISKLSFFAIAAKEINIQGCYCYNKKTFKEVIEMLEKKQIKVSDLISAKFDLDKTPEAFAEFNRNYAKWYKVLIKP
jgi:L-iditol 2-dehydrogenase